MTDQNETVKRPNNIILENRKKLSVSGVKDVGSFDEHTVVAFTDLGELTVKGERLHIDKLSVETGELVISGNVNGFVYTDDRGRNGGFFGRILK